MKFINFIRKSIQNFNHSRKLTMQFRIPVLDNYNSFVGYFITLFAEAECHLRHLVFLNSSLTREQFNEWVGWPSCSQLIDYIKKILKEKYSDEVGKEVKDLLVRLNDIMTLRNRIVHYGGHIIDDKLVIRTHRLRENDKTDERFDVVDQENLEFACADLQKIIWFLSAYLNPTRTPEEQKFMNESLTKAQPWRYKPI